MPAKKSSDREDNHCADACKCFAVNATSKSSGDTEARAPNAPPTSGQMRCTCIVGRPKTFAISACARDGDCVPTQTVILFPSLCHCALHDLGSSGQADKRGIWKFTRALGSVVGISPV